jgi:pyruvate dehydrogenase E2 component (dihydrolipoamide acetyltransferase)
VAKQQVTVPDIGGADGAEVIEVLVAVGDEVALEQGLIVLESDKASMEIPSEVAGTVVELRVAEGQELSEGDVIAVIETGASPAEPKTADTAAAPGGDEPRDSSGSSSQAASAPEPAVGAAGNERTIEVPDIGTDDAVDLTEISVAVGDIVAEGDSLVVLESDKASMEVPAPVAGEILAILVEEGTAVRQGHELVRLRVAGQEADAASGTDGKTGAAASSAGDLAAAPESAAAGAPAAGAPAEPAGGAKAASAAGDGARTPVYAGPAVRKLARELGVELSKVKGSGPRGRLLKEDLHAFVQSVLKDRASGAALGGAGIPAVPETDFAAFGKVEVVERSKLDKLTAVNMQRSWLNVPHVTQFDEADITDLEEFRASLKAEAEARGTRLTPLPFLLKACAIALRDAPKFRSSLADGGETLVYKQYTHIGMAVDTPAGLLVPVIRDVDQKTLWELAEEVPALAARARDRKLKPAEMKGGCFTVSSLGNIGGRGFTPVVNTPEVGILGVSRAQWNPVWNGEEFRPRKMLPLCLSYDHRVINGGDGGRFLTHLVALLGDIRRLAL